MLLSESVIFKVSVSSGVIFFHKGSTSAVSSPTDIGQCSCLSPFLSRAFQSFLLKFLFLLLALSLPYEIGFRARLCCPTPRTTMVLRRWLD